jgi:hypothetical protein
MTLAANFSYIPWGSSLTGFVKLANKIKACEPI